MPTLTLIDVLSIQDFVFTTNLLRHAVAGSALVDRLASWVRDACGSDGVVFAAGGNAALRFADVQAARAAMGLLSRRAHDEAPGLELTAVHREYQPGRLAQAILDAQVLLQQAKLRRRPTVPLLGLGVTAVCVETHRPATTFWRESPRSELRPVARAVACREEGLSEAAERWNDLLPVDRDAFRPEDVPVCRLRFPTQVDHLGRTRDDQSVLGVVHIDGNGVGRAISQWLQQQAEEGATDEAFCTEYRRLSGELTTLARAAFKAVVDSIRNALAYNKLDRTYEIRSRRRGSGFALHRDGNTLHLPVRLLVLGGDDLTFVCDGRLALDLAAAALSVFQQAAVPPLGEMHACAGVAITRTHAPILRAYELAESLCASAKREVRKQNRNACALDWHIGLTSPTESLDDLRERQYRKDILTRRPYFLDGPEPHRTWNWLAGVVDGFAASPWSARRSKVKQLPDLARQGRDAVERALAAWQVSAPDLRLPGGLPENGYHGDATSLLDAVELLDLHLPLDPGE